MKQASIFDLNNEHEFTWKSKHIKFFLDLPNIGPNTVEKIIEILPDISQWDKEFVASMSSNYEKFKRLLPNKIPNLEDLDEEMVMNFKEDRFPKALKQMPKDRPLLLWYKGNLNIETGVAVVGSRNILIETKKVVQEFIENFRNTNVSIVSGLAKGVDEEAHLAALKNKIQTIAVLPSSLDNILPSSNSTLAYEIVDNGGLLVSEYAPGSPRKPENSNYIARNRLQAGFSDLVFVAQSSIPGGTMSTAKFALEYFKKLAVYKSNQNINTEEYKGNKYLLEEIDQNFNFKILKFTKKYIEILKQKQSLADYSVTEDLDEILKIFLN